jgi:glucose/arabinose dehydrogenase
MLRLCAASLFALTAALPAFAQDAAEPEVIETEQESFTVAVVAEGLEFPWAIAFLPSGEMLVSEREGRLRVVTTDGGLREAPVAGIPDDLLVERQGGLMDIALAPDFETSRLVYFTYAEGTSEANRTTLARGRLNDDLTALEGVEDLFRVNRDTPAGFHFAGRILFNDDGTLFVTIGDGGRTLQQAQNVENHLGTVVRLNLDGSIPADNPDIDGAAEGIYSYGHRNPQGIARHPETGSVWTHEHGPRGGDELNILIPGANFGWPTVSYGINYSGAILTLEREREEFVGPLWYWAPSIAPSGMAFYDGDQFEAWQGDLFVSALSGYKIERLEMDGDRVISTEDLLVDREQRYRDVRVGPDGSVYLLVDDIDGQVLRLDHALTEREEEFEG